MGKRFLVAVATDTGWASETWGAEERKRKLNIWLVWGGERRSENAEGRVRVKEGRRSNLFQPISHKCPKRMGQIKRVLVSSIAFKTKCVQITNIAKALICAFVVCTEQIWLWICFKEPSIYIILQIINLFEDRFRWIFKVILLLTASSL